MNMRVPAMANAVKPPTRKMSVSFPRILVHGPIKRPIRQTPLAAKEEAARMARANTIFIIFFLSKSLVHYNILYIYVK